MNELPLMASATYGSTSLAPDAFDELVRQLNPKPTTFGMTNAEHIRQIQQPALAIKEQSMTARIVKVYIADPNENLPLDKRVLHSGEEKLTDLTDQELFFEVPINELLTKHNEFRKTVIDKKQAEKFGRDIYLEPARIRDLKMVVVNVAQF
jgi:hypothetical protein